MFLVPAVLAGKDGIEQVALHVEVGIGIFVKTALVGSRLHAFLQRVAPLVGFHEQDGGAVIWRQFEDEVPTVLRQLDSTCRHPFGGNLCLNEHLMIQPTVVYSQHRPLVIDHTLLVTYRSLLSFIVGTLSTNIAFCVREGSTCEKTRVAFQHFLLFLEDGLATAETCYLVALHRLQPQHLVDGAFNSKALLRLVAQCLHGPIAAPPLHHHQQVEARAVFGIIALEIVAGIGHEALQVGREQQLAQHRAVVVARVVGMGIANRYRDGCPTLSCRRVHCHLQRNRLIGVEVGLAARGSLHRHRHIVVVHEKKARS